MIVKRYECEECGSPDVSAGACSTCRPSEGTTSHYLGSIIA